MTHFWRMPRTALAGGLFAVLFVGAAGATAEEQIYEATMTARRGLSKIEAGLTITVTEFSTEEDGNRLDAILQEQGSAAFFEALRESDRGVASVRGGPTAKICYVRVRPGDNGSRVIILTDGPIYFPQDERQQISTDVIGVIQILLNAQGRGRGSIAEATKVRMTGEGSFEVEASQVAPVDIENVRQVQ